MNRGYTKAAAVCIAGMIIISGIRMDASASIAYSMNAGVAAAFDSTIQSKEQEPVMEQQASAAKATKKAKAETICGYTNLGIADVENHLNIRVAAGEDQELVGKLPVDAGCEILETEGEWVKIKSGNVTGYVKKEFLITGDAAKKRADEVKSIVATTNTQTVYLRTEPNTDSTIWTAVPEGEELEVVEGDSGKHKGWTKVSLDGDECYVFSEYVDLSEQLAKGMTITESKYGDGISDVRVAIAQYATQFVGNRYKWGGVSLTDGVDCSGFTMKIYQNYGVYLPHSSSAQSNYGTKIDPSEAMPGDLFFYSSGGGINHVAMYIGGGQVVHASSAKTGIKISNAFYRSPVCVTRLIND